MNERFREKVKSQPASQSRDNNNNNDLCGSRILEGEIPDTTGCIHSQSNPMDYSAHESQIPKAVIFVYIIMEEYHKPSRLHPMIKLWERNQPSPPPPPPTTTNTLHRSPPPTTASRYALLVLKASLHQHFVRPRE
ncbi:hypothetical protein Pmani_020083 [Petrolisthes manimaculis]|uniref:Uncharacterized protein n=1 Tax=Petrolisthes manimaculis TaxID=1843537 RepID=A0AAE1PHD8_9EUCA|nr:hypothetical protein Pmani_020083 [Petrolisthes manimaculis]